MPENISEQFNWASYVDAVTTGLIAGVASERGYRQEFVQQLCNAGYLGRCPAGRYVKWRAFPVHDVSGTCIAAHLVKSGEKVFVYNPTGTCAYPFIIGDLANAAAIHVFESQWDMFAVMDRLGTDPGRVPAGISFVSTRGASNVAGLDERLPSGATVIAWTQNDTDGHRWSHGLQTLCLRSGLSFGHIAPPRDYKDFNEVFRGDADGTQYTQSALESMVERAVQGAVVTVVSTTTVDEENQEELDSPPSPFPVHRLPQTARDIVEHGAEVMQVPRVLMAVSALGALSTAVGAGIAVQSKLDRKSYPNLYILAAAASGAGKSEATRLIYAPVHALETELIRTYEQEVAPRAAARMTTLTAKAKKLARASTGVTNDGEHDGSPTELELAAVQTELQAVEQKLKPPKLIVGDTTTEALGALLAKYGALASFSSDARDEINNVLGRYRDKGQTDEGLYIKMWSGDVHQVDRIGREPLRLVGARLSLLWLVQPDKLYEVMATESLWSGGLLPRMLLVETGAQMQHFNPDNTFTIPETVIEAWAALVRSILERYRQATQEREPVQPTLEARRVIAALHNRGVDQVQGGAMRDLESFVARWAEQAWRISLLLHVAEHPADAEAHPLTEETASAAVEIVDWFCLQQTRLLARGREEKRRKKLEKLVQILELAEGREETMRNLRDRHNWDEQELQTLAAAYPTQIAIVERPPGAHGGRPSRRVKML